MNLFQRLFEELDSELPSQKFSSAKTSIDYKPERSLPIIFGAFKKGIIKLGPVNADIGGGKYDTITNWLKTQGVDNLVYDRFNRTSNHNMQVLRKLQTSPADTATVSNVLNVIAEPESRLEVIRKAHAALKSTGIAYFSMYKAPKAGEVAKRDSFQIAQKNDFYLPEIQKVFGNILFNKGGIVAAKKQ